MLLPGDRVLLTGPGWADHEMQNIVVTIIGKNEFHDCSTFSYGDQTWAVSLDANDRYSSTRVSPDFDLASINETSVKANEGYLLARISEEQIEQIAEAVARKLACGYKE